MPRPHRRPGVLYSRVDLSHYHLYAAFLFASHAERLEEKASPMAGSDALFRYRSFVMGAVLSSVAFLEAKLAELGTDAADGPFVGLSTTGLTVAQRAVLEVALNVRAPLLERYQAALRALAKSPFKADRQPYRAVALVVALRNFLVHFPAEWLASPDEESGPLRQRELPLIERQLRRQFPSTKFADPSRPFFPDHCLSSGWARWAAEASLLFAREFSERTGVPMLHPRPILRGA